MQKGKSGHNTGVYLRIERSQRRLLPLTRAIMKSLRPPYHVTKLVWDANTDHESINRT